MTTSANPPGTSRDEASADAEARPRVALVTGATGFIGGELVKELLTESERTLICPVRASSPAAAARRGADRMTDLFGLDAVRHADRVEWVRGDLEEPQLGWNTQRFGAVARRINEIFHCAASVSFDLPLEASRRINVDGTINVFALAQAAQERTGRFARFHHLSSAFVSGHRKGLVSPDFVPGRRAKFRNNYERSKAEAERFLVEHASATVPVTIHRPSIVGGDTQTGVTDNWNVLYGPMRMVARGRLPTFVRGGRDYVDAVGVDFVVRAIRVFAELDTEPLHHHHLTAGDRPFTVTELFRETERRARMAGFDPSHTDLLSPTRWRMMVAGIRLAARAPKRMSETRRKGRLGRRAIEQSRIYVPYAMVHSHFDHRIDREALLAHDVEMPPSHVYMNTIIDYALLTDFGKRAIPVEAWVGAGDDTGEVPAVEMTPV